MTHPFVNALRAIDPEVSSDDLADVAWLAAHMYGSTHKDVHGAQADAVADPPATPVQSTGNWPSKPHGKRDVPPLGQPSTQSMATLTLRQHGLVSNGPGVSTRSPGVPAVPEELEICRALRPLQRRVRSARRTRPDETATAEWIAETGLWVPFDLPVKERWLDVALVVDDGESMIVWHQTVAELRVLLQRTGAFRDVRVWYLDGDLSSGGKLSISAEARPDTRRDPSELVDPTQRRLILVASDCVGRAWSTGAIAEAMTMWASACPTAILQMLPQRLWARCAPELLPVRLRGPKPGVPNSRLMVTSRDGDVGVSATGVPIPVFELEDRWLKPWADLVAGATGEWVNGTAVFTDLLAEPVGDGPGLGYELSPPTPRVRVAQFRAHASHEAFRLAVYLAAAPLSLAVMRLVQGAMLPLSKPSHLAEVFLSDLLRKVEMAEGNQGRDDIEYDFQPGIRDELLRELPKEQALQLLARVSSFVSQRLGSPLDFQALLTSSELTESTSIILPFAQVAIQVLGSMGGRYADAARRLTRLVDIRSAEREFGDARYKTEITNPGEKTLTSNSSAVTGDRARQREVLPKIMRGVPSRNPRFTGRADLLESLHTTLVSSSERVALLPHALHGLGGVGKTQLAIEYVYRHFDEYDLICWLPAHDVTAVRSGLVELGAAMGLPENGNVSRAVDAVLDALRTDDVYRRWLLVFDNADRPEDLRPYLPHPSGHVLITSRNPRWSEVAKPQEIGVFPRQESIALLRKRAPGMSVVDADRLADRLGDLPLAVEQAGAWQAETGMPVDEYLRLFEEQFDELTQHPPSNYPLPVGATYHLALQRLREEEPAAAQLLDVCAFVAAEPISIELLRDGGAADLPSPLDQTLREPIRLRQAVRAIGRYALARVDPENDRISLHRLVQQVIRGRLTDEQRDAAQRQAQGILAKANPSDPDSDSNSTRHAELSPHILPSDLINADDDEARLVVLDQIRFRWLRGDYESSRDLGELTVSTWEARWGDDDILTLLARRHLAVALRTLGDYGRARQLTEDTLEHLRVRFGDDHEHTMVTADSVSWDRRISGRFREAKELDEENLARARRLLGENDPFTLKAANNLAIDLRWLGDFDGARRTDEESVRRRGLVYGQESRHTQLSISSLARDHYGLGEYATGLELQNSALTKQQQILGPHHAEVLSETRNLIILLRKTGDYIRACDMARVLVHTYEQRFYPSHEGVLAARMTYCNTLLATTLLEEAQRVGEETLERSRSVFGNEHPVTLVSATNLAIVLRHRELPKEALALNEKALATFREVLGPDHPFTLCCATNTSNDFSDLHRHDAARELSEDTLRRSRMVRGVDHPYTHACALNVALDRQTVGDTTNAESLLADAIAGFTRRLGQKHPETLAASARRRADCDIEPPET